MVTGAVAKRKRESRCPNPSTVHFPQTFLTSASLTHPMTSTSDTDSYTAAEPVQILTPPPSPPLAGDDETATATAPSIPAAAKKKKKKKAKKPNKAKEATTSPVPPPTPTPTVEENQPPPLYISRNKHWKYISSFHVRFPLWSGPEGAEVQEVI